MSISPPSSSTSSLQAFTCDDDVRSALSGVGVTSIQSDVLSQCVTLAQQLHLSPAELATGWLAYYAYKVNQQFKSQAKDANVMVSLNGKSIKAFKRYIKQQRSTIVSRPNLSGKRSASTISTTNNVANKKVSVAVKNEDLLTPSIALASLKSQYDTRKGAGTVVVTYESPQLPDILTTPADRPRCVINAFEFDTNVSSPYRHMFTTCEQIAESLKDQLEDMEAPLYEILNFENNDNNNNDNRDNKVDDDKDKVENVPVIDVGEQSSAVVYNIGRICNMAHEGKLNKSSILLEGARKAVRIPVNLTYLIEKKVPYSFFPGQIVALKGRNSTGRELVAYSVYPSELLSPSTSTLSQLRQYHYDEKYQNGQPLRVIVAAGPFTAIDNIEFTPLSDLKNIVMESNADVVILLGPFISLRQNLVRESHVMFEEIFKDKISALFEELYKTDKECQTQFVLVPSLDDATTDWVLPQAPFQNSFIGNDGNDVLGLVEVEQIRRYGSQNNTHRRIHCVSNPATIRINEMVIGMTSVDILKELGSQEINENLPAGSRPIRLATHVLEQQCYYPLFPSSSIVNFDRSRWKQLSLDRAPDIMILPSDLQQFAQPIGKSRTLAVNPGLLMKAGGISGGTYASLTVYPLTQEQLSGDDSHEITHNVADRVKVEVIKI